MKEEGERHMRKLGYICTLHLGKFVQLSNIYDTCSLWCVCIFVHILLTYTHTHILLCLDRNNE